MDTLSPAERSNRMNRVRSKDSKAELVVRRMVHKLGYRYRLHRRDLPGTPDLVFSKRRKVLFVHGCFWHRHDDHACKLARLPKTRLDFWLPKLERNRARDQAAQEALGKLGWSHEVVWECELRDREQLRNKVAAFLESDDARD